MPNPNPANIFFDINRPPPEKGLLLFGLSINKLFQRQSPENCILDIRHFHPAKVSKPIMSLNFIYSNKPASELKNSIIKQMIDHKNGLQKIVEKNNLH